MKSVWRGGVPAKKIFVLFLFLLCAQFFSQQNVMSQNTDSDDEQGRQFATRHEVLSYEAANLALRLPSGSHLLVISGPMDTYMLGHLRDAMIANRDVLFSLDLSAVSALFNLDKEAFNGCANVVSLVIPDGTMEIRWECFLGCDNLIAINATENCDSFSSVDGILYDKTGTEVVVCPSGWNGEMKIPLSVSSVRSGAFANCPNLTAFALETRIETYQENGTEKERVIENDYFSVKDGILYSKDMKRLVRFPGGKSGRVQIPETVEAIGTEAFAYGRRVTSVEIPEGVRSIEKMAFGYCDSLASVKIPESMVSIGKQAFVWCTSLGDVTIPRAVTYLGSRAFFKSSLSSLSFAEPDNWTFGKKILVDLTNPSENAEKFRHPGKYWFLDLYKVEQK